jgi:murein L,D-transpeptidase YafK
LCDGNSAAAEFAVSLGRKGTGKKLEGDEKTPLGVYPLESTRSSSRFGIFIPVGYPTSEQKQGGFSGSNIGIHGPDKTFRWLGRANTWLDWTNGCIAVATMDEMQRIADWVRVKHIATVDIR